MSRWQTLLKIFFGDFALQAALLKYLDDFIGNCIRYSRNFWTMKKKDFSILNMTCSPISPGLWQRNIKKLMYISSQKTLMVKMCFFFNCLPWKFKILIIYLLFFSPICFNLMEEVHMTKCGHSYW